jgi:nitrate reductase alpha subunit
MAALGPLTETLGSSVKGVTWVPAHAVDYLHHANGTVRGGAADGRPALLRDVHLAEAILALSGTTNGQVAVQAWQELEKRTGVDVADPAAERAGDRITPVAPHPSPLDAHLRATLWSVVFPLGMYRVATLVFAKAAHLAFM